MPFFDSGAPPDGNLHPTVTTDARDHDEIEHAPRLGESVAPDPVPRRLRLLGKAQRHEFYLAEKVLGKTKRKSPLKLRRLFYSHGGERHAPKSGADCKRS